MDLKENRRDAPNGSGFLLNTITRLFLVEANNQRSSKLLKRSAARPHACQWR